MSVLNCAGDQPGGFAHGPEEKNGRAGRAPGRLTMNSPSRERAPRWDGVAQPRFYDQLWLPQGAAKDSHAALHNTLKLLGDGSVRGLIHGSPQLPRDSSR